MPASGVIVPSQITVSTAYTNRLTWRASACILYDVVTAVDDIHKETPHMGRKKSMVSPDMTTDTEGSLRPVRLELPEDVHTLLRLEAARQDVSLGALARTAVEEYLLRRKVGGK